MLSMIGVLEVLLAVVVLLVVRHYYKTAGFWGRRGIQDEPGLPVIGSSFALYIQSEFRGFVMQRFYKRARAKGEPCVGLYIGPSPTLLVTDMELVRAIMTKDFSYFMNRGLPYDRHNEPLTANLFNLEGNEWRSLRHKLTPTFTSGRMRAMFPLVLACAEELSAVLAAEATKGKPVEMFEILARFTTDIIGTCAFGIQANALKDPEAEFRVMGRKAIYLNPVQSFFVIIAPQLLPLAKKLFGVRIFNKTVTDFFTSVFMENFEFRKRSNVLRHDFVDLLLQLKTKGSLDGQSKGDAANAEGSGTIEEDLLPAQAFIFFLAGFETSSSALGNTLTELAHHPNVQERARDEVRRVLTKHGGKLDYEAMHDLVYMEQVIEETMRMYPATSNMSRVVTERYTLPIATKNGKPAVLEKGMRVIIPTFAIHRDPEFYQEPNRFNPDNFSEEVKKNRPHYTYMPFGEGPRICIGQRFAMMQMKAGLTTILRDFRVSPVADDEYPPRFDCRSFVTKTCGGNKVHLHAL